MPQAADSTACRKFCQRLGGVKYGASGARVRDAATRRLLSRRKIEEESGDLQIDVTSAGRVGHYVARAQPAGDWLRQNGAVWTTARLSSSQTL